MTQLKCCPFCDTKDEDLTLDNTYSLVNEDYREGHSVQCQGCGVSTAHFSSPEEAVKSWNARAVTPPASTVPVEIADALADASQAIIERWETPKWKDALSTAQFINRLRNKLSAYNKFKQENM